MSDLARAILRVTAALRSGDADPPDVYLACEVAIDQLLDEAERTRYDVTAEALTHARLDLSHAMAELTRLADELRRVRAFGEPSP